MYKNRNPKNQREIGIVCKNADAEKEKRIDLKKHIMQAKISDRKTSAKTVENKGNKKDTAKPTIDTGCIKQLRIKEKGNLVKCE